MACFPAVAVSVAKASVDLRDYPSCLQGRARQFSAHEEGSAQLLLAPSTPSWRPHAIWEIQKGNQFISGQLDPEVQDNAKPVLQLGALFVFMWDVLTSCSDL